MQRHISAIVPRSKVLNLLKPAIVRNMLKQEEGLCLTTEEYTGKKGEKTTCVFLGIDSEV